MADGKKIRWIRLTKGKLTFELTLVYLVLVVFWRFVTWGFRRCKPLAYHPFGYLGLLVYFGSYAINPWITANLMWALVAWRFAAPDSYFRNVQPRIVSFFAGFKYRYRPRRKLEANGLLNDKDPVPTVSWVQVRGCVTKIRIKMSDGDEIEYWRERQGRIAQTYNAGDLRINRYRPDNFWSLRPNEFTKKPPYVKINAKPPYVAHYTEKVDKWRWLELEFMTKNPFNKAVGFEYIDFHRVPGPLQEIGRPVGPMRDGSPYCLLTRTHLLCVAMSGRGKSNAERAMVYAEYEDVLAGYVENWIFDGGRGTEAAPMKHCFARVEKGKDGPMQVLQFFKDLEKVLYRRLDEMEERGINLFVPDPHDDDPLMQKLLRFYIDEIMVLETVPYADVKTAIYKIIAVVLQQGRKAGISIRAFAQNPKLDRLPMRDDFPEIQIGGLQNRRQIDTAIAGGWDLGAREIPEDLPGVFYVKTEAGAALDQIRYAHDRDDAIRRLKPCPDSVLWPRVEPPPGSEELREEVRDEVLIA